MSNKLFNIIFLFLSSTKCFTIKIYRPRQKIGLPEKRQ